MKIYIYGNQSFKKEIHEILDHSNIKFKLDDDTVIKEIKTLTELKEIIKNNPKDIYLIDDDKIIKKNSLNKKLKFLAPKDGIEEEYLIQSGISDLLIDSLKELPKYIIKRYEELKQIESNEKNQENKAEEIEENSIELDDELSMLLSKGDKINDNKIENLTTDENLDDVFNLDKKTNLDEIENLVGNIENHDENDIPQTVDFNDNFGLNNISFDYDDNDVLYKEEDIEIEEKVSKSAKDILDDLDFLGEEVEEEEDFSDLEKINSDLFGGFDFLNEEIQEGKLKVDMDVSSNDELENEFENLDFSNENIVVEQKKDEFLQEDNNMNDEFFELDSLDEKDLIEALNYKVEENSYKNENKITVSEIKNEKLNVDTSNINDLSLLISKLLNNKTLEITIKIKD